MVEAWMGRKRCRVEEEEKEENGKEEEEEEMNKSARRWMNGCGFDCNEERKREERRREVV